MGDKFSGGLDKLTANAVNDGLLKAGAETFVAIGDAVAKGAGAAFNAGKAVVNGVQLDVGQDFLAALGKGFSWGGSNDNVAAASVVAEPAITEPNIQQASLGVLGVERADFNNIQVPAMNRAQPKPDALQAMYA